MGAEHRKNPVLRGVLRYLNFDRGTTVVTLPPLPTGYLTIKNVWFVVGLLAGVWAYAADIDGITPEAQRMLAISVMMAIWWITEALPVAITALFPLVAFPLMGIAKARVAAAPYADPNIFLFLGGFMLAACMQRWGLHRRIALGILLALGGSPRRILLGCMGVTAFLSMWASNTATVLMMFPIAMALVDRGESASEEARARFATCLLLGIAYAGSMGGVATLIGTPPNIVFAAMVRRLEIGSGEVPFLRWMILGIPVMFVMLVLIYFLLTQVLFRFSPRDFSTNVDQLREAQAELGPMSRGEGMIAALFSTTALLWITRKDIQLGELMLPGWSGWLPHGGSIHDGTVAIAMAMLMFILPVDRKQGIFMMDRDWHKAVPWDIVILFGGGFALAQGFLKSGLSAYLGGNLGVITQLPELLVMLLICLFMTFLTEFTSNTATTTVMLPILAATATAAGQNPLLYMLPATLAASAAFMLPVATPPNAIVFASGQVTIREMARTGVVLNLVSAPVIALLSWWLGPYVMGG